MKFIWMQKKMEREKKKSEWNDETSIKIFVIRHILSSFFPHLLTINVHFAPLSFQLHYMSVSACVYDVQIQNEAFRVFLCLWLFVCMLM